MFADWSVSGACEPQCLHHTCTYNEITETFWFSCCDSVTVGVLLEWCCANMSPSHATGADWSILSPWPSGDKQQRRSPDGVPVSGLQGGVAVGGYRCISFHDNC